MLSGERRPTWCFVQKAKDVGIITCLERTPVIVLRTLEYLGKRAKVDTKWDWTVAAVERKAVGVQFDGDESDVGVIHSLQILCETFHYIFVVHERKRGIIYSRYHPRCTQSWRPARAL